MTWAQALRVLVIGGGIGFLIGYIVGFFETRANRRKR